MMIQIITMGNRMPGWIEQAYSEYAKRLPNKMIKLIEIPLTKRLKGLPLEPIMNQEGQRMLEHIPSHSLVITLEIKGTNWSTPQLATQMQNWQDENRHVSLLIGGPEGLAAACTNKSHIKWSLSALTLPHPLVRIMLIEQLYRAWTILTGHPYHK